MTSRSGSLIIVIVQMGFRFCLCALLETPSLVIFHVDLLLVLEETDWNVNTFHTFIVQFCILMCHWFQGFCLSNLDFLWNSEKDQKTWT